MPVPKSFAAVYPLIIATVLQGALLAAQSAAPAPAPGVDCFPYLLNVSDCLSYVESGSNRTEPEKGCCPELAHLVDAQPVCLCQLLSRPAQLGIPLDIGRALKLPSACNVSTPPVTLCAGGGGILVGSPSPGPAGFPSDAEGSSVMNSSSGNGNPSNLPTSYYLIGLSAAALLFIH